MNKQRKFILAAVAIGVIATFLPWFSMSAGAFGYSVSGNSRNGFHEAGIFYFIFLIVAGIIAFVGDQSRMLEKNKRLAVLGGGVLSLICVFVAYSQAQDHANSGYGFVSVDMGVGIMLAFAAAAAVIVIPLLIKNSGESLGSDLANIKGSLNSLQSKFPTSSKETSPIEELEKLNDLRTRGLITEEEYTKMKSKII